MAQELKKYKREERNNPRSDVSDLAILRAWMTLCLQFLWTGRNRNQTIEVNER